MTIIEFKTLTYYQYRTSRIMGSFAIIPKELMHGLYKHITQRDGYNHTGWIIEIRCEDLHYHILELEYHDGNFHIVTDDSYLEYVESTP